MKCYYEVLNIEREADGAEIKTAYRKLALKWHPDKNLDNADEAKEQFQLVQNAYEVLSDPQERAWYDNHREQLLKGAGTSFSDDSLDLIPFFTASCFKGFGDDEGGFYQVYREVFQKLISEEVDYLDDPEDAREIPQFGKSDTPYEQVQEFYAHWLSFSTSKSYVWLDKYDIREADNRKVLKLLEKENQKIRQKARKERNEEIRELAAFIRKRDRRVKAHMKMLEEKAKENKKKMEETRKEKIKQRQLEMEEAKKKHKEVGVYNMNNLDQRLEEIEKHLAEEFGDSDSEYSVHSDDELEDIQVNEEELDEDFLNNLKNLYCSACNKSFKNVKSFENHEKSKKHKENVMNLQRDSDLEGNEENETISPTQIEATEENKEDSLDDEEISIIPVKSKKKKNKKQITVVKLEDSEDELENTLEMEDRSRKARKAKNMLASKSKPSKKSSKQNGENKPVDSGDAVAQPSAENEIKEDESPQEETESTVVENVAENENATNNEAPPITKNKKVKKISQKKKIEISATIDVTELDIAHCCAVCKNEFSSKNKLFDHLKKTGHQIYIPTAAVPPPVSAKSKKKKDSKQK